MKPFEYDSIIFPNKNNNDKYKYDRSVMKQQSPSQMTTCKPNI